MEHTVVAIVSIGLHTKKTLFLPLFKNLFWRVSEKINKMDVNKLPGIVNCSDS